MPRTSRNPLSWLVNLLVGALIGLAEMVPGVSGGTIALVVGIYERAVRNGDAIIHAVRVALSRPSEARQAARRIEWGFLITVGIGMVGTVLALSGLMHDFVDNHPEKARALFLGMVAVSLIVPLKMVDRADFARRRPVAIVLFLAAAVVLFFLTGLSSTQKSDPSLIVVFFAAAIAVCALVLPGISGSFILLIMGLYSPIMGAVGDRDVTVMAVFILGAVSGLALFIKVLNWLLTHHHTLTMIAMAGLMLGSLRALWPWQDAEANLLAPSGAVLVDVALIILGGIIAGAIMLVERLVELGKPAAKQHQAHR